MLGNLTYPGKKPEHEVLQQAVKGHIRVEPPQHSGNWNQFYRGDNLPILLKLLPELEGKVDLIYIDPPFGTGQVFANMHQEAAYEDTVINHAYLEFLRQRLLVLRACLAPHGSMYVHIDKKVGHYVRVLMDEVFGVDQFINDLTRIKCNPKNFARKAYGNYTDMILYYAKQRDQQLWYEIRQPLTEEDVLRLFPKTDPTLGPYTTHPLHAPGESKGDTGQEWRGLFPPPGRHWRYSRAELDRLQAEGLIEWSATGNPRKKVFAKDHPGKKVQDLWEFKDKGMSYVDYPTQKNEDLLERIIQHSSAPGDLVLDAFAGSGNSLLVAHRLGRKWIGMDQSPQAEATFRRLAEQAGVAVNYKRYVSER